MFSANVAVVRWPLTGRERELAEFERAWADGRNTVFVVAGPAGVGTSRLAEEYVTRTAHRVLRVTATRAVSAPLGAVAHLIPPGVEPTAVIAAIRPGVVLVEDVQYLDPASAILLRGLLDHGVLRMIATLRTGEPCDEAVAALVDDAHRTDVVPFDTGQVGALLGEVLAGPVSLRAVARLAEASGGVVRYLRELVQGTLADDSLSWDGELWRLAGGPLAGTPALTEMIKARLAVVPAARSVLERLALGAPVSVRDVGGLGDLVRIDGTRVSLAHPLYGEVLRAGMSVLRRQLVLAGTTDLESAPDHQGREDELIAALPATARETPHDHDDDAVRALTRTMGLALVGKTDQAISWGERAHATLVDREFGSAPAAQLVPLIYALADAGTFDRARSVAEEIVADPALSHSQIWSCAACLRGRVDWLAGDVRTARYWYAEAVAHAETHHFVRPLFSAYAGLAASAAVLGDLPAAEAGLARRDQLPPVGLAAGEERVADAWIAAARGDLAGARAVLVDAATEARASGNRTVEMMLLTDLARLGAPMADRLAELAECCTGSLAVARSQLAGAAGNPERLDAAAEALAALGAYLLAAEAGFAAATAWARAGRRNRADAASERAKDWAARCPGATTPALAMAGTALTVREREIALLAAAGESSRAIADALRVSPRTVENHLRRVYTKVGVRTRRELARAIGVLGQARAAANSRRVSTPSLA